MLKYEKILDDLGIVKEYEKEDISKIQKKFAIIGRSMLDAKEIKQEDIDSYSYFNRADIYGINQCLHLASSFVLLGSKSEALSSEISKIRKEEVCQKKDPTTIISIAALYYILVTDVDDLGEKEKEGLCVIKDRFEELCWMVGEDVRKNYLEIPGGVADE